MSTLFLFRPRKRLFSVLSRRFEVPVLDLGPLLRTADRRRDRVQNPRLDAVLDLFRSKKARVIHRFRRAHEAIDAQDAVIYAATDHVAAYAVALTDAATWIGQEARKKLKELATTADERRRLTANARLQERGEEALARDLELVAGHMRHIARTAALCLSRLARYRRFVDGCGASLASREDAIGTLRAELVHDEQTWLWRERLEDDPDLQSWSSHADSICADIETMLRGLHKDLAGIEQQLKDIPVSFARLLASDAPLDDAGLTANIALAMPELADLPTRLDDGDWDEIETQHIEAELLLEGHAPAELRTRAEEWLSRFEDAILAERQTPPCELCRRPVASASLRGRAHALCPACRASAALAHSGADNPGLDTVPVGTLQVAKTPVTRAEFDAVMGYVPERTMMTDTAALPLTRVTWLEAIAFCNKLSTTQGLAPAYRVRGRQVRAEVNADGWRLPTLAEWTHFTVTEKRAPWWKDIDSHAWHAGNSDGQLQPTQGKKPNPLGIFDALGNAAAWLWQAPAAKGDSPGGVPRTFDSDERLAAGGGFSSPREAISPETTFRLVIEARDEAVGFRPIREPTLAASTTVSPVAVVSAPRRRTPATALPPSAKTQRAPKSRRAAPSGPSTLPQTLFGILVTTAIGAVIIYHLTEQTVSTVDDGQATSHSAATSAAHGTHAEPTPAATDSPRMSDTPPANSPATGEAIAAVKRAARAATHPAAPAEPATPVDPKLRKRAETLVKRALAARTSRGGRNQPVALRALRDAIAADAEYPEAQYELALLLAQMGRFTESSRAMATLAAITREPEQTRARELLAGARADATFQEVALPSP